MDGIEMEWQSGQGVIGERYTFVGVPGMQNGGSCGVLFLSMYTFLYPLFSSFFLQFLAKSTCTIHWNAMASFLSSHTHVLWYGFSAQQANNNVMIPISDDYDLGHLSLLVVGGDGMRSCRFEIAIEYFSKLAMF